MAVIPNPGYYWRTRCGFCGVHFIGRRSHAVTCGATCRQAMKREGRALWPHKPEYLGFMKQGQVVKGKLGERLVE